MPEVIRQFSKVFTENGYCLYVVGGAVRDWLLGIKNSDYDFCTDAMPEDVVNMFRHVVPTGIKHGTVTVLYCGNSFEVTTFRCETSYSDKRHPDNVRFVSSLQEDLSRRDFTVNAFAADCSTGEMIDLFNGIKDLESKTIRAIGNAHERFSEDALRLMRMCRFAAKLDFKVDEDTFNAAKDLASAIKYVSQERIFDELDKTLSYKVPSIGINLMSETGLLDYVLPELSCCREIKQDKVGSDNVYRHIINSVDAAACHNYSNTVRWALLLHDTGKPACMKKSGDFVRFYGHDVQGAVIAREVLTRLKCSNKMTDTICLLIANHMVRYTDNWTDGAVKRFINRVGLENINMLFEVQWCDQIASEGVSKHEQYAPFIERIKNLSSEPLTVKDLAVNGNDLADAGIPRGKQMGEILEYLLEMVIDYPSLNDKETLLKQARLHMQA